MRYRCVDQFRKEAGGIAPMCQLMDVSRSGYYAAKRIEKQQVKVCPLVARVHAAFAASGRSYGSRRIGETLRQQGVRVGRYRVRRIMRSHALKPVWKRRWVRTTESRPGLPVAPNHLNRQFNPERENQAWVADITTIQTGSGWLYLAAVMDLYSRKIIGWEMAPTMPAELVCSALQMAIGQRCPAPGLMVHTDRGCQYASAQYQRLLEQYGIQASMSRKGNCLDNSVMERFFLNLKMERVWQRNYANHAEARRDIADYIAGFYNSTRLHSTLGYRSPNHFEKEMTGKNPIRVSEKT